MRAETKVLRLFCGSRCNTGVHARLDPLVRLGLTPQGDIAMKEAPLEDKAQDAGTADPFLLPPCQACTERGRSLGMETSGGQKKAHKTKCKI